LRKSPGFHHHGDSYSGPRYRRKHRDFQPLDAVRLRSLPVSDPQALATIQIKGGNHGFGINTGSDSNLTYPLWQQIQNNNTVFLRYLRDWTNWGFQLGQGTQSRDAPGSLG
jgi:hypothetical protein